MGKTRETVTLTQANVQIAKKARTNFSGLLDALLAEWIRKDLKKSVSNLSFKR